MTTPRGGGAASASVAPVSARSLVGPRGPVEPHEVNLEALPMPTPRSTLRRRKAHGGHSANVSALDSEKSHTPGLQEALAITSHLMHRSSRRQMIARILEDSYVNAQLPATLEANAEVEAETMTGDSSHEAMGDAAAAGAPAGEEKLDRLLNDVDGAVEAAPA